MLARPRALFPWLLFVLACSTGSNVATDASTDVMATDAEPDAALDGNDAKETSSDGGFNGFVHPGVLVNLAGLDFVKAQLAAKGEPWTSTLARTTTESGNGQAFGSVTYTAHPVATIDCTADAAGCSSLLYDAIAAYTSALTFYYSTASNHAQYAQTAIAIMNAWSSTAKKYNGSQAQLETAWAAEMFPRAAEIIRYTYTPSASDVKLDVAAFSSMLLNVFKPQLVNGAPTENGNWELSMADGLIDIGVFTEDQPTFQAGIAMWKARTPAYVYLTTDNGGNGRPFAPPGGKFTTNTSVDCYWLASGAPVTSCTIPSGFAYVDGMVQETCRDMTHVLLGMSSLVNAAETARIQGIDLYGLEKARIVAAYEFTSTFDSGYLTSKTWPAAPCGGQPGIYSPAEAGKDGVGVGYALGWEIAFNEYATRLGVDMGNTSSFITTYVRPSTYKAANQIAWESLTSVGTP